MVDPLTQNSIVTPRQSRDLKRKSAATLPSHGSGVAVMSFHGGALQIQVTLSIPIEIRAKDVEVDLLTRREANLTVAQNRVLDLIMTGLENTEIANELHVTTRTAKFHVSNVLGKMGCANRTELVRAMATRQGEKECGNGS